MRPPAEVRARLDADEMINYQNRMNKVLKKLGGGPAPGQTQGGGG